MTQMFDEAKMVDNVWNWKVWKIEKIFKIIWSDEIILFVITATLLIGSTFTASWTVEKLWGNHWEKSMKPEVMKNKKPL